MHSSPIRIIAMILIRASAPPICAGPSNCPIRASSRRCAPRAGTADVFARFPPPARVYFKISRVWSCRATTRAIRKAASTTNPALE
jgi:hypothetical protein